MLAVERCVVVLAESTVINLQQRGVRRRRSGREQRYRVRESLLQLRGDRHHGWPEGYNVVDSTRQL
jgi:hypothetical protein